MSIKIKAFLLLSVKNEDKLYNHIVFGAVSNNSLVGTV